MGWHVRAAVVGSSGNVGGGLGVSLVAVWHCAGSLSRVELRYKRRVRSSLRKCLAERPPLWLAWRLGHSDQCLSVSRDITLLYQSARGARARGGEDVSRVSTVVAATHPRATTHVWASRPRRSTSCGSGLSLRSEAYYFSAPNIAYFTVYSTTRAHDSLGSLAPLRAQSQGEAPRLRAARCGYLLYTSTTPYHLRPCGVPSHSDE